MNTPKSPEEALNNILTRSEVPTTQAMAARGLATTSAGHEILKQHIKEGDLPKLHVSLEAVLKEVNNQAPSAAVAQVADVNLGASAEHGFQPGNTNPIPAFNAGGNARG